ncbi:hypothetical protein [Aquimarina algiphila]|uniref:Uncharacterized protein n=1 Tax=Aquimarina algiphila TaxID=2047982 RepID=A0A554VE65_9FLAO|nr:hypothetical protein [Aquimarina algiphila]TSE05260.1 hypothetical protein FOF46_23645 [Aquimarina algiphila]
MKKIIFIVTFLMICIGFAQKPMVDVIRFETSSTTPSAPSAGWLYMDDSYGLNIYNGTTWNPLGGLSGINITDGTNTLNGVSTINFTGATISGTSPNGMVTISGGGGSGTGLELKTENGNDFWTLVGRDPANYGDRGAFAIDFSFSNNPSTTKGATGVGSVAFGTSDSPGLLSFAANGDNNSGGDYSASFNSDTDSSGYASFSAGEGTSAPSYAEFSIGSFPIVYTPISTTAIESTDRIFNVANGTSSNPKNAFTIFKNGSVILYPVSKSSITNAQSGMIIFDSDEANKMKYYDGTNWREITTTVD